MSLRAIFGTFDGVHLGHRALFSRAVELCEQDGLTPIAMIIHREGGLITDLEERARLIKATGVSRVEVIPLEGVRHKSAEEFIEHIKEAYGVSAALCGYDFRFGKGRCGTPETLCSLLPTEVIPEQRIDGVTVSSTAIRLALKEGRVEDAARLLGRGFSLEGKVASGKQLGRTRGYPTANIPYEKGRCPLRRGVYFTCVKTSGGEYNAISNLGTCPTVGGGEDMLESYLLDFDGTLYGESISVELVHFHRDEERFPDIDALYTQINADLEAAKGFFGRIR